MVSNDNSTNVRIMPESIGETHSMANKDNTPLLKLPPELRNIVYRYVLLSSKAIRVTAKTERRTPPALLQVCDQIRSEASSVYYVENTFFIRARIEYVVGRVCTVESANLECEEVCRIALVDWLKVLRPSIRKMLRRLVLDDHIYKDGNAVKEGVQRYRKMLSHARVLIADECSLFLKSALIVDGSYAWFWSRGNGKGDKDG